MSPSQRTFGTSIPVVLKIGAITVFIVAIAGAGIFSVLKWVLHPKTSNDADVGDLDLLKAVLTILGSVGLVLGAVYAYRRHELAEGAEVRSDAELLAERFAAAGDQIGHASAAVRMVGLHAMSRLADEWPTQQQACVDVLCAYLRIPPPADAAAATADKEVRRTLVRLIRDHLRDDRPGDWSACDFSFEGAVFEALDLTKARFKGDVTFYKACFGPDHIHFNDVQFAGRGVWMRNATFRGEVEFDGACFSGKTSFDDATFDGDVRFDRVRFCGEKTSFRRTTFDGRLTFKRVIFGGAKASFEEATFPGEVTCEDVAFEDVVVNHWGRDNPLRP